MFGRGDKGGEHEVRVAARHDAILEAVAELRALDPNEHARLCDLIGAMDRERRFEARGPDGPVAGLDPDRAELDAANASRRAERVSTFEIPAEHVPGLFGAGGRV